MDPAFASRDEAGGRAGLQLGLFEGGAQLRLPRRLQRRQIQPDAKVHGRLFSGAGAPEFLRVGHEVIERGLGAGMRCVGTVAQAHHPVVGMAQVVAGFFDRLGRNGRECLIGAEFQLRPTSAPSSC